METNKPEVIDNVFIPTLKEIEEIAKLMWKVIVEAKSDTKHDIFTLPFSSLRSIDHIHCRGYIRASFNRRRDKETINVEYLFESFFANTNSCRYCHDENESYYKEKNEKTYVYLAKKETFECRHANVLTYLTNIFTNEIPSLRYNTLTSTFEDKTTFELNQSLGRILSQISNIIVHKEVCCVCLEGTKFITSCNHSICPPCLDRIILASCTVTCSHAEARCPICRENVADGNLILREF